MNAPKETARVQALPAEQTAALRNLKAIVMNADQRYAGALDFVLQTYGFQKAKFSEDLTTITEVK